MEEALVALFLADAALAGLIGSRIHWGVRPQGEALPGVTLFRTDGAEGRIYTGGDGFADSIVQADCWAETYAAAKGVARALKAAAVGRHGAVLKGVFVESERDGTEHAPPNFYYRVTIDLRVLHQA